MLDFAYALEEHVDQLDALGCVTTFRRPRFSAGVADVRYLCM
jgi:hypothetical protein